jgi:hypothetical protein
MITRMLPPAAACIVLPTLLVAQEPEIDMEARRQSVVNLGRHIEQREKRLEELRADIRALDDRIEKRTDELVTMLTEITDSQQSARRVSQIKMRAIDGLRRWIRVYRDRRVQIFESLRREGDNLPREEIAAEVDAFDKRIDKRVGQILELTASMPGHEDVEKYESDGGSYWNGWYHESTRVSEDWKQNRRDQVMSDKTRRDLISALETAIRQLEQRRAALDDTVSNRKLSAAEREIQLEELGRVDASLERRRRELRQLATTAGGGGTPVGRNQAHDIERLIEDAGSDLSEDFRRLLRMYDEFNQERNRTFELRQNLKAREAWLQEHDK